MMRVRDALLIEGTSRFAILCYAIVPMPKLSAASESLRLSARASNSRIHKLVDETWPNGVLLGEFYLDDERHIATTVASVCQQMFDVASPLAVWCMYDGAFGTYDDIFSEESASQTYAFCFHRGEPVVVLDERFLASAEWSAIIADCRSRFRSI
jgi:hypothetical protein